MNQEYPKVLIINTQSIKKNNATGITLRTLWEDWPANRIMEIYTDEYEKQIEDTKSFTSISIAANILKKIAHSGVSKKINAEIKQREVGRRTTWKSTIRQAIILYLDAIPCYIPKSAIVEIDSFSPDVIYTLGASVSVLNLAYNISEKYKLPIVIHYMDNWPECLQWEANPLIRLYRVLLNKAHNKCLGHCTHGLAISPQMAEEYTKLFHIPFSVAMNCVDVQNFHIEHKKLGNPVIFLYAGGLHLERWVALKDISRAIQENDINAQLHIYSSSKNMECIKKQFLNNTFFHNQVNHIHITDIYQKADVLVHVETDNPQTLGFFKYSISTKIPEYLSSGRITLFYGPQELGLYQYLKNNEVAYVASEYSQLKDAISKICINYQDNEDMLCRAYKFAEKCYNASVSREVLRTVILDSVLMYPKLVVGQKSC